MVATPSGRATPAAATRRRALTSAGAALALTLEGCGAHKNHVKSAGPVPVRDIALLGTLLDLEYKTTFAYEAGIPLLDPASAKAAKQFLPQEEAHAGELAGLIKKAGGKPFKPRAGYDLGQPRTAADVLALLHALEAQQISVYLSTLPRLSDGKVRSAVAAVMANDAQHLAIVRGLQHRPPAPAAFVTGQE